MDLSEIIQINLLPWREKARKIQRRRFYYVVVIFLMLFLIIAVSWHIYNSCLLKYQITLNNYLQSEIDIQTTSNTEFLEKVKKKKNILAQLNEINFLLRQGYNNVSVLNELITIVPHNIVLTAISKNDNTIDIQGKAETDNDITLFKQVIQHSPYFMQPALTISSADKSNLKNFTMTFKLKDK